MKYYSPATDLSALERELGAPHSAGESHADDPFEADYSDYADKYAEGDDEDERRFG